MKGTGNVVGIKPNGLVICAITVTLIITTFFSTTPTEKPLGGGLADIKTEPYIYVPNGEGSELLLDMDDNFYMIHLVEGDLFFRKYNYNHILAVPDTVVYSEGDNTRIDAKLDDIGYIHISWSTSAFGGRSVMYMKLDSDGNVVVDAIKLSATNNHFDQDSRVATNSLGQAYVVWSYHQGTSADWPTAVDVLYAKIDADGSVIFTQYYVAPPEWATGFYPNLLVDFDNNLHIVYQRGDRIPELGYDKTYIYYKKFASDGTTVLVSDTKFVDTHFVYWVATIDITLDSANRINIGYSQSIKLPADGGAVETWFMKIDLNGNVLVDPKMVSIDDGYHSTVSYLATDEYDYNYIFWSDAKDGNYEIYYTAIDTDGAPLVSQTRLTNTPEFSSTWYMAAVFDSGHNCYWSYWQVDDGTYVIYPVNQTLIADAGPDQKVNEGDLVHLDGSGSTASGGLKYWDSFVFGADSWITTAPPATILANFSFGGSDFIALAATDYGSGKAVFGVGALYGDMVNIGAPGNVRHQIFINSVRWATNNKDPRDCNIIVVWGHREVLTYHTGVPGVEGSNVTMALEDWNYNVNTSHDIPSSLAGYDALVIPGIGWSWGGWVNPNLWSGSGGTGTAHKPTASEVSAALDFVQNGGGLVASAEYEYGAAWLNDISTPMGVQFAAIDWAVPLTAYRVKQHPIFLKWGDDPAEIISYEWDFTSDGTYDYIENISSAPDGAFDGMTTHVYGDNGVYNATLRVTDESGASDTDTCLITVLNLDPVITTEISAYVYANITLRLAGEKRHDVTLYLYENDTEVGIVTVVRSPGSPDRQSATIENAYLDLTKKYSAKVVYTPEDDPVNGQPKGANPAWIILKFEDGSERRIHHTFNVNHEETWVWYVELNQYLVGHELSFEAHATDQGSDDLTFNWSWGDGTPNTISTYYNDGAAPDPYPSPWGIYPFSASDEPKHVYGAPGDYIITLTVMDDDSGVTMSTMTITLT